ncbi:hypothetical protein ACP4OV_015041 [Aristida adscensionis]
MGDEGTAHWEDDAAAAAAAVELEQLFDWTKFFKEIFVVVVYGFSSSAMPLYST